MIPRSLKSIKDLQANFTYNKVPYITVFDMKLIPIDENDMIITDLIINPCKPNPRTIKA